MLLLFSVHLFKTAAPPPFLTCQQPHCFRKLPKLAQVHQATTWTGIGEERKLNKKKFRRGVYEKIITWEGEDPKGLLVTGESLRRMVDPGPLGFAIIGCMNAFRILKMTPHESETFQPLDIHHGMEVRLGLSKRPVCPSFIGSKYLHIVRELGSGKVTTVSLSFDMQMSELNGHLESSMVGYVDGKGRNLDARRTGRYFGDLFSVLRELKK